MRVAWGSGLNGIWGECSGCRESLPLSIDIYWWREMGASADARHYSDLKWDRACRSLCSPGVQFKLDKDKNSNVARTITGAYTRPCSYRIQDESARKDVVPHRGDFAYEWSAVRMCSGVSKEGLWAGHWMFAVFLDQPSKQKLKLSGKADE